MGGGGNIPIPTSLNPITAAAGTLVKPLVEKGIKKAKGVLSGPDAPDLEEAPTTAEATAALPDKTRRRLQVAQQGGGRASTILTGPSGVLGDDVTTARKTLLGS